MEDEIKVGEFVRTKKGYIAKFIHYGKNGYINGKSLLFDSPVVDIRGVEDVEPNILFDSEWKKEIVKHSRYIIDLIEIGDYVNGSMVVDVDNYNTGIGREVYCEEDEDFGLWNEHIESVITHEQIENMKYKVKEEDKYV